MPVYMSGKEDIWEKACQITTRRGLKADSHCVGIREAEEALAHIREWDFSHVDNRYSEEACPGITGKSSCLGTGSIFWTWTQGEANFCFHWAIHTAGPALPRQPSQCGAVSKGSGAVGN